MDIYKKQDTHKSTLYRVNYCKMKSVPICVLLLRVNQQTGNNSVVFTCLALVSVILKSVPPPIKGYQTRQ